jgi:hypothetical protein
VLLSGCIVRVDFPRKTLFAVLIFRSGSTLEFGEAWAVKHLH